MRQLDFVIGRGIEELQEYDWAAPWENVSSGVSDQVRLKPACTATEAS